MKHLELALPDHTVEWMREFTADISQASNDTALAAELIRMTERQQRVMAGTWDQNLEAEFLAFQRAVAE